MTIGRQDQNREDVRFRVLSLLQEHPEYSQRDIARALGVSLGSVNYCVNALIEKGHVKLSNFRSASNKLRYMYVLTAKGIAEKVALTGRFLQRKRAEYEALRAEIEGLQKQATEAADPERKLDDSPINFEEGFGNGE